MRLKGSRKRKYLVQLPDTSQIEIEDRLIVGRESLQDHVENVLNLKFVSREQLILSIEGSKLVAEESPNSKNGIWLIRGGQVKRLNTGEKLQVKNGDELSLSKYFSVLIKEN